MMMTIEDEIKRAAKRLVELQLEEQEHKVATAKAEREQAEAVRDYTLKYISELRLDLPAGDQVVRVSNYAPIKKSDLRCRLPLALTLSLIHTLSCRRHDTNQPTVSVMRGRERAKVVRNCRDVDSKATTRAKVERARTQRQRSPEGENLSGFPALWGQE